MLTEHFQLTSDEATDMVTYWLPSLQKCTPRCRIVMLPVNIYEQLAQLTILPAPRQLYRLFMMFGATNSPLQPCTSQVTTTDSVDRHSAGLLAVEWGGMHIM